MADQVRTLTTGELLRVSGGFEATEDSSFNPIPFASQQLSNMMAVADFVIRGVEAR